MKNVNVVEDFIQGLLVKNDCKSIGISEEGELYTMGMFFPLKKMTKLQYFPTIESVRIDTDVEYCLIDFEEDHMESFDKDSEVEDND